jgi:hypothetical protein
VKESDDLAERLYGILDDWKAQQYGGAPIVEAIQNLTAVSGTAARRDAKSVVGALEKLTEALTRQQEEAAARLVAALRSGDDAAPGTGTGDDGDADRDRRRIRENVAELRRRMGPTLDTGDRALHLRRLPHTRLSEPGFVVPGTLRAGRDAAIYGAGLEAVTGIRIGDETAEIHSVLPGEVSFTVPSGLRPGTVDVVVELHDAKDLHREVRVGNDVPPDDHHNDRGAI